MTPDDRTLRIWRVVRIVEERFEVQASSAKEALALVQNPYSVKVLKEGIYPK